MGKHPYIDPSVKLLMVQMSGDPNIPDKRIAELAGVHISTLKRVCKMYKETGQVVKKPEVAGRRRRLSADDIEFVTEAVANEPELTLHELRDRLAEERGVHVSLATVSRTMKRCGFVREAKKVPQAQTQACDHEMREGDSDEWATPATSESQRDPSDQESRLQTLPVQQDAPSVVPDVHPHSRPWTL